MWMGDSACARREAKEERQEESARDAAASVAAEVNWEGCQEEGDMCVGDGLGGGGGEVEDKAVLRGSRWRWLRKCYVLALC